MTRRISGLVVAVVVALLSVLAVALPARAAVSVSLISSVYYAPDEWGNAYIVGEVRNTGDQTADFVRVTVAYRSAAGQVLGTELVYTEMDQLLPGEKSPFIHFFEPPAGFASHEITSVLADPAAEPPNRRFTTTITNRFTDASGLDHIVGQVRNDNTTTAEFVEQVFSLYDDGGQLVDARYEYVNTTDNAALAPGETGSFELVFIPHAPYTTVSVVSQSLTPPSGPSASPSPSASASPTASTGPSPSASPTPSGSPPAPGPPAPTLEAPAIATAGVLVTVSGFAAPGSQVELWGVTAPNATITRVNTPTVTADSSGRWAKQIRPLRNVNLQARVGSAASATRFIAVKTAVRQSVAPLAGCVVQVSGAVFEPKPGRTVFMRAVEAGRAVALGTGTVQADGRFLLRKPYACGRTLAVYTVIEGDAVNRPGATGTQAVVTRR